MFYRLLLSIAVLTCFAAGVRAAETPEAIVRGIYAGGGAKSSIDRIRTAANRGAYFQPALVRLFDANDREECIDFGLYIDGQDFDEKEIARSLRIEPKLDGERATVDARFTSFGKPNHYRYDFVRSGETWKIADIASLSGGWRLSSTRCGAAGKPVQQAGSAASGSPALAALRRPGRTCFGNRSSGLKLIVGPAGDAQVVLEYLSPQSHVCKVEGRATPITDGWHLAVQGDEGLCKLDLAVSPARRMTVRDADGACSRNFCGARAWIADAAFNLSRDKQRCRN